MSNSNGSEIKKIFQFELNSDLSKSILKDVSTSETGENLVRCSQDIMVSAPALTLLNAGGVKSGVIFYYVDAEGCIRFYPGDGTEQKWCPPK